jgi:hypothetical protein
MSRYFKEDPGCVSASRRIQAIYSPINGVVFYIGDDDVIKIRRIVVNSTDFLEDKQLE